MGRFGVSEKIVSSSAILISLLTLIVFTYQTSMIREQQFLSVYPHLSLYNTGTGSLEYTYMLSNEGIGPAIIESIQITKGEFEYESLVDYLGEELSEADSIWIYNSDIYPGRLIPAGEDITLFGLIAEEDTEQYGLPPNTLEGASRLRDLLNTEELEIKIYYRSIYEERWSISSQSSSPTKLS